MLNLNNKKEFGKKIKLSPARVLVIGFASIIIVGTILLSLPISVPEGRTPKLIDSLFTATSAVCVTGLVVVNTGDDFSLFGVGDSGAFADWWFGLYDDGYLNCPPRG